MTRILIVLALASGLGLAPQASQTAKPPVTSGPQTPATRPGSIDLTITSQTGALLSDATVRAEGPTSRQGTSTAEGDVVLTNVPAGTYRCRIERTGYITLEKEIVVKVGARTASDAVLSPAPTPPPAPAPAAPPPAQMASPMLVPGAPLAISLVDQLANDLMNSKDPVAERAIGCSGATAAKLIRLKDGLPSHTHAEADEMIYMVAGNATLTLGGKDQTIGPGWLAIVPRGMAHAINRKGNNQLLLLSIQSGPACANNTGHGAQ